MVGWTLGTNSRRLAGFFDDSGCCGPSQRKNAKPTLKKIDPEHPSPSASEVASVVPRWALGLGNSSMNEVVFLNILILPVNEGRRRHGHGLSGRRASSGRLCLMSSLSATPDESRYPQ
jgi:hypothetical protein